MDRRSTMAMLGLGLAGAGLYRYRRELVSLSLGLAPADHTTSVTYGLPIRMPDGVILLADHYAPVRQGTYPTILMRTPYGRGPSAGLPGLLSGFIARRFAERGYHVIIQDVRGRFGSGGEFVPFVHEAADGHATIEWIGQQTWFNGVLGMWGRSYGGYVQWAVATGAPQFLKALVPGITGSHIPTMGLRDRALVLDTICRWILQLDAIDRQGGLETVSGLVRLNPFVQNRILERAFQHLPLSGADEKIVGRQVPFYQKWLAHADVNDGYWESIETCRQMEQVTADVHLVSGWYDILLRELLYDYTALREAGHYPYLTIGPWSHFDPQCSKEVLRQGLIWFDVHLKGDRRRLRSMPVRVLVMGEKPQWREMEAWPPPTEERRFFLEGNAGLSVSRPEAGSPPDRYIYDPHDPTPAVGGPLMSMQAGPRDNRALEARADVLTYTTRRLGEVVEVMGTPSLRLYVHSSLEYTDFFGRLCDVYPDGRSINVCDGLIRVEPGVGELQPDGSLLVEIELWPTAYRFGRGHCIRLQVSSGAHPRWSRNPGSGEPLRSVTRLLPAHQTIYHDAENASALFLPVREG